MTDRPILFSGPMVRAILAGTKTQTRRLYSPLKPEPWEVLEDGVPLIQDQYGQFHKRRSRYGETGDRLWVRETWMETDGDVFYRATDPGWDEEKHETQVRWRSPRYMPRWASRITLEVTGVRFERLQDISEDAARAEGVEPSVMQESWSCMRADGGSFTCFAEPDAEERKTLAAVVHRPAHELFSARQKYSFLWNDINGKRAPWSSNPWVWVVSFTRVEP